jgi:hypothetical protein
MKFAAFRGRSGHYLFLVMVAFLSFLAVNRVIAAASREWLHERDEVHVKLDYLREHPKTDVVVIGTSRVQNGFDPERFDEEMREKGHIVHSQNLGVGGLSLPEEAEVVDEIFQSGLCCVRYFIIEPDFSFMGVVHQPFTVRAINYFDLRHVFEYTRYLASYVKFAPPAKSLWHYISNAFSSAAVRYLNLGLFHTLRDRNNEHPREHLPPNGFLPYDTVFLKQQRERGEEAEVRAYHDTLRDISKGDSRELISDYQFGLVLELVDQISKHGGVPIILRMPQIAHWNYSAAFVARLHEQCGARIPYFLDFGDPKTAATLFDLDHRHDEDHLNRRGAALLSEMLAERLDSIINANATSAFAPLACRVDQR